MSKCGKKLYFIPIIVGKISLVFLFWNGQGLIQKIENPEKTFQDERKYWIGEEIRFLRQENAAHQGKYVGFCWDPEKPRSSVAEYSRLVDKQGRIEEAWWGNVFTSDMGIREKEEIVVFWKVRMISTNEEVWYWDDGGSYVVGAGFTRDYKEARSHMGDSLWAKDVLILYSMSNDGVIRLRNLQKVILTEVQWGEYGNYPLRFILETEDGQVGYRSGRNLADFLGEWYRENPRHMHKDWKWIYWAAIENRKLTPTMNPEMVRLAWGEPLAEDNIVGSPGIHIQLWIYRGINKRIYGLFFINGKLVFWQWKERKRKDKDILQFELKNDRIHRACRVSIDWKKLGEVGKNSVTFLW